MIKILVADVKLPVRVGTILGDIGAQPNTCHYVSSSSTEPNSARKHSTCIPEIHLEEDPKHHTQKRVQPDLCYFTVQITGINFECSL